MLWQVWVGAALAADPEAPALRVVATEGAVVLDGRLDEPVWAQAPPLTELRRYLPAPGGAPQERVSVRFAQDAEHLYVAVQVADTAAPVRARLSPREDLNDDDQIGIYLDTFNDGRNGYVFYFNALGVQQDMRVSNGEWSLDWNTVLRAEGQHDARGFTLEVAIPFSSLRYPEAGGEQTWGLIVTRKVPAAGAKYAWPTLVRGHPQLFAQAGRLEGVLPPSQRAALELMPVFAARQAGTRPAAGAPWEGLGLDPWHEHLWPALDLRLGLGSDARLAATLHPDFSQVEGDPSQLDLNQRFAFYFPERRPFFLEGVEAFTDPADTFYSRRVQAPAGGLKLSGLWGPALVGVVSALDLDPLPSMHEDGTPGFSAEEVAGQRAVSSFARARTDLGASGVAGVSVAHTARPGAAQNLVGSADLDMPLGEVWSVRAQAAGSGVWAGPAQLGGVAWSAAVDRSPALGPGLSVSVADSTPGYRNELAYLTQSGVRSASLWGSWAFAPARGPDRVLPGVWAGGRQERDGDARGELGLSGELQRGPTYAGAWASGGQTLQGGVAVPNGELGLELGMNPAAWLDWSVSARAGQEIQYSSLLAARYGELSLAATVRPLTWLRVDLSGQGERFAPLGAAPQVGLAGWGRVNVQLSRALGLRLIADYSTASGRLSSSQLVSWVLSPGTEAYLGATQATWQDKGLLELSFFAKVSVLWRPAPLAGRARGLL